MIEKYLNNRYLTLYILPFFLGCLSTLSFQPFNLSFINFLILPLYFYLLIFIKKKSKSTYRKKPFKKNLLIFGTLFGFGFYFSGIYWINYSLTFDQSFKILIPLGLFVIPLFLSLFFSLTTLLVGPFLGLNFSSIFLFSASLAFSDFIRSKILTGFPWNLWAYSFSWATEVIQILNKVGLFAFNLITISIFMVPIIIIFNISLTKKIISFFFALLLMLFLYIYGNHTINKNKIYINQVEEKFYIKVISPNLDLKYGLSQDEISSRLQKLIKYSEPSGNHKTLFIWPEGVFSGYNFRDILHLQKTIFNNFNENHFILFGVNRYDQKKNGTYNSLVIINNKMEIIQEYNKNKLVPFGEFMPLENLLKRFGIKKITEGYESFLKGKETKILILDNLKILPLICYEIIFTELVQQHSNENNIIISISEDGWFGDSIGPHQHFSKSIFRAIENDTFVIRSTNKGISAILNNKGEVLKKLNPNEVGNIELNVPLIKNKNKNKNDLIFLILLITYVFIFFINKKNYEK